MSISSKSLQLFAIVTIVSGEANLHLHKSSDTKFLKKQYNA